MFKRAHWGLLLNGFLIAVALVLIFAPASHAEDYSFEVPKEDAYVVINPDSSITFTYDIEFKNNGGAKPIDIIDMGMPTGNYDLAQCSAYINSVPISDIRTSTVISPGVEVHLGENAIQPGATGLFKFTGSTAQMVYADTEHQGYASMEFMNTYWDSMYAFGETNLRFSIQFPPGVQPKETIYHGEQYTSSSNAGGTVVFTWEHPHAVPIEGVLHGVSFPAVYVAGVYPQQPVPVYEPVSSSDYYDDESSSFGGWSALVPILISAAFLILRSLASAGRVRKGGVKANYITPAVSVEGAGPKTDLGAAEAAVLMNQPLDRVSAIAFMELMQKGIVTLEGVKPIVLRKTAKAPQGLQPHGNEFLAAVSPEGALDPANLKMALTILIKRTEKRMKGFCHADTVKYYEELAKSSWVDVKMNASHEEKLERFNELLPYLMLDSSFKSKVRDTFTTGEYKVPLWIASLAVAGGAAQATGPATGAEMSTMEGGGVSEAISSAFSAVQDTAYPKVEDMEEEVVKEVNPTEYNRVYILPRRGYHSSFGGGGGGCACACACAGCACACAGGGR